MSGGGARERAEIVATVELVTEAIKVAQAKYAERYAFRHGVVTSVDGVCDASLREAVLAAAAHVMAQVNPGNSSAVREAFGAACLAARADEAALRSSQGRPKIATKATTLDAQVAVAVRRTVRVHLTVIAETLFGVSTMLDGEG